MKLNTICDFLCHEGLKNVYFVRVRNVEGENCPEHTVSPLDIETKGANLEFSTNVEIDLNRDVGRMQMLHTPSK